MPVPEFVTRLRAKIGHDPIWCPGAAAVVLRELDGRPHVLLHQRSDTGRWGLPGGMVEPGEEPSECIVREVAEETGVTAVLERLVWVRAVPRVTYPNGDQVDFLELVFALRWVAGEPRVTDDESLDARWCAVDELPELQQRGAAEYVAAALSDDVATRLG